MPSSPDLIAELTGFGVATLHEASGRRGLTAGPHLIVGPPFAGPAVTVALAAGDNLGIHLALEAAEPGSVVCVGSGGGGYGVYGDLLHESGRAQGVVGFVIDDCIRDIAELDAPPSVACRGVRALGTIKRRVRQPVGAEVALGGVLIKTGDWLVADHDGVLVVAQERLEEILTAAAQRVDKEAGLRVQLRDGALSTTLLDLPAATGVSIS